MDDKVEAKIGDKAISISGPSTPLLVALLVVLAVGGYFINDKMEEQASEHKKILEAIETMAWIESLPADRRPELIMPEHVQRRLRGQHPYDNIERSRARGAQERTK